MPKTLVLLFVFIAVVWAAKPMEPLTNYNVIMVHGAATSDKGMEHGKVIANVCGYEAYRSYGEVFGAADMMGKEGYKDVGKKDEYNLTYWLDSTVFENVAIENGSRKYLSVNRRSGSILPHFSSIYFQRPFMNPAEAPSHNAREIGDRLWQSDSRCSERRSLIEEAQEVRAEGRGNLRNYRTNPKFYYEDSLLPPSRNILIAHSMGGVASREYVQGDFYRSDVDKLITLDSPHDGTYSLDAALDMKQWLLNPTTGTIVPWASLLLVWSGLFAADIVPVPDWQSLLMLGGLLAIPNGVNGLVNALTDWKLGYDYKEEDPLVSYIRPGSSNLKSLNSKPYGDSLPMLRILSSVGGLVAGSNSQYRLVTGKKPYTSIPIIVPNALYNPVQNLIAQASHTEVSNPSYYNNILSGTMLGLAGGLTFVDHGSSLVPHWSGSAKDVAAFKNNANVQRYTYMANENTQNYSYGPHMAMTTVAAGAALMTLDFLGSLKEPTRLAIGIAVATGLATYMAPPTIAGVWDMVPTHKAPVTSEFHSKEKGTPNTYPKVSGGDTTITPYLMEEFLYERPFANIRVHSTYSDNWENLNIDSLSLFTYDSTKSEWVPHNIADNLTKSTPLNFKRASDWEVMGAKKTRWTRVAGADGQVPIRHIDRHPMPGIMLKDFIRKYEFEIDDLMPHRLRQIRLNFNFDQEIAWECDVDKAEGDDNACTVYKRTPNGAGWTELRKEKHPVSKTGIFTFVPEDYYDTGLATIQKDNQNTV